MSKNSTKAEVGSNRAKESAKSGSKPPAKPAAQSSPHDSKGGKGK